MADQLPSPERRWTIEDAERWLLSLEVFGMKFGLQRMRRLMTVLGNPQQRFRQIHVVGSNGKSSTVRMIAAILERHGLRTGAYLSPHLVSFAERVQVGGRDVAEADFAGAVARAARATAAVDRSSPADEPVTQFEAITAAAYDELARQGVQAAVIEAGLGGRYDATNVIDSQVQVLTNVSLEHTRWLGPTIADITAEKVDVVRPHGTLVVGARLHPDALAVAARVCEERGARLVVAPSDPGVEVLARGPFQRRNFALAAAAAHAFLGALDAQRVAAAAAATIVPGRFEVVADDPVTVFDGAHNPDGMRALAEALRAFLDGRRLVACLSVLEDKDAARMLEELLPLCDAVILTAARNPRALPPATLESLTRQLGGRPEGFATVVSEPHAALAAARRAAGPDGVALATGSLYLIADLLRPPGAGRGSIL
ncbi:MAG TPA: cyanophycin synthetase [Solirubrobacteraceae bacterium]|nr:cyanophycin synthetase [Solirubrobacteraceae bacterium]